SLQKGLDVLTCFGRQHARLTVSEVARLTEVSPASARRSLLTLQQLGYLDSDGKRFWMLPRVLLVAQSYLASRPMPSLAQPRLAAAGVLFGPGPCAARRVAAAGGGRACSRDEACATHAKDGLQRAQGAGAGGALPRGRLRKQRG